MLDLRKLGRVCKTARKEHGYTQVQVAIATEYSVENVSAFETGRNGNMRIFFWYVTHCFAPSEIYDVMRGAVDDEV